MCIDILLPCFSKIFSITCNTCFVMVMWFNDSTKNREKRCEFMSVFPNRTSKYLSIEKAVQCFNFKGCDVYYVVYIYKYTVCGANKLLVNKAALHE